MTRRRYTEEREAEGVRGSGGRGPDARELGSGGRVGIPVQALKAWVGGTRP